MNTGLASIVALVVVLILLVMAAYVWYNYTGWKTFSYSTGDSPSWTPTDSDISSLRFKDCSFVVQRGDGKMATLDATAVLNSMAVAYAGATKKPLALTLVRPLNPFSFVIPGFNDRASVPDPTVAPWCTSPPSACSSDGACPGQRAGACSSQGVCTNCPGGATVTLVGQVRTI